MGKNERIKVVNVDLTHPDDRPFQDKHIDEYELWSWMSGDPDEINSYSLEQMNNGEKNLMTFRDADEVIKFADALKAQAIKFKEKYGR